MSINLNDLSNFTGSRSNTIGYLEKSTYVTELLFSKSHTRVSRLLVSLSSFLRGELSMGIRSELSVRSYGSCLHVKPFSTVFLLHHKNMSYPKFSP